ncbi:3-isopropylmalate dehydratase large subunit [Striga asiatica]|uniref:3-isopropylmalate dehydratase large subunit n=1 Tax=Striga asiatica TaxID=4170 RepID=A0A5A7PZ95_STRAF|nr:3-isopropylmalate dehydratase large subunit [Striga asiatica]
MGSVMHKPYRLRMISWPKSRYPVVPAAKAKGATKPSLTMDRADQKRQNWHFNSPILAIISGDRLKDLELVDQLPLLPEVKTKVTPLLETVRNIENGDSGIYRSEWAFGSGLTKEIP